MSSIFLKAAIFLCFSGSLWLPLATSSCKRGSSSKETSSFDTNLVWQIAQYERTFANAHIYDTSFFFSEGYFKKHFPDIGLTVRMFVWGGETGGPHNRILHFKPDSLDVERAFGFYDEYCFLYWRGCSAAECLRQIAIGRQLTELSRDLNYHNDLAKMNRLLTVVMDSTLAFQEIVLKDTTEIKESSLKLTQRGRNMSTCTREAIEKIIAKITEDIGAKRARFFDGELINGIWRVEIKPSRKAGRWEFEVSYLNHECAHILWM